MNSTNETTGAKSAAKIVAPRWWSVRPALRITLLIAMASAVAFFAINTSHVIVFWDGFRMPPQVMDAFQPTVTLLAIASVVAVFFEARRTGRLSLRRPQTQPQPQT